MPRFLMRGSAEGRHFLALPATGVAPGFLDAAGKGTALSRSVESNETIPSSALRRRARYVISRKHGKLARPVLPRSGELWPVVLPQGTASLGRHFASVLDSER